MGAYNSVSAGSSNNDSSQFARDTSYAYPYPTATSLADNVTFPGECQQLTIPSLAHLLMRCGFNFKCATRRVFAAPCVLSFYGAMNPLFFPLFLSFLKPTLIFIFFFGAFSLICTDRAAAGLRAQRQLLRQQDLLRHSPPAAHPLGLEQGNGESYCVLYTSVVL